MTNHKGGQILQIPYWERYLLTIREAAEYFHIGEKKLRQIARKMHAVNYDKPGKTNAIVKAKFYMVRMLQTSLGKQNPEYTDFQYWNENGWLGKTRPWKQA